MRPFVPLLALLVLGIGFLAWRGAVQSADGRDPGASPEPESVSPLPQESHTSEPSYVSSRRAPEATDPERDRAQSGLGRSLRGRVELADIEGRSVPSVSGTLILSRSQGERGEPFSVVVDRGGFELERSTVEDGVRVDHVRSDSLFAVPRGDVELPVPEADAELLVELVVVPDIELHVRSAATGAELGDVLVAEVLGAERYFPTVRATPQLRILAEGASSPVSLRAIERRDLGLERDAFFLHVAAGGHAPRSLRLDVPGPRVVELELEPAGSVEVTLVGPIPEAGLYLDLTHSSAPWTFERVPVRTAGPHRFEDVPAGDLLAELFVGTAGSHDQGLTAAWVEIQPGEAASVELVFEHPEIPSRVPFSGTLHVDHGWGAFGPELELVYRDVPPDGGTRIAKATLERLDSDDVGGGRFHFDEAIPGPNRFAVPGLGWQSIVEVPADGSGNVQLEVPHPCRIEIAMLARATGDPVEVAFMGASAGGLFDGPGVGANTDVLFDGDVGRVTCAAGPVKLTSFAEAYGVLEHHVLVERDGQRFELEVDSEPMLELEFTCAGEVVEIPLDARIWLRTLDGEPFFRWSGTDGPRHRFGIETGEPLTVWFEDFFGFEQPDELGVESSAGEDVALRVELVRAR